MTVLGVVAEVQTLYMTVNLPNSLTGMVALADVSPELKEAVEALGGGGSSDDDDEDEDEEEEEEEDGDGGEAAAAKQQQQKKQKMQPKKDEDEDSGVPALSSLFRPGQVVVCSVLRASNAGSRFSIQLSLSPALVNKGVDQAALVKGRLLPVSVVSAEDRGYVVNTGLARVSGFVPKKEAASYVAEINEGLDLQPGQTVLAVVTADLSDGRVVKLSLDPKTAAAAAASKGLTFDSLSAGLLVHATVHSHRSNGIGLAFHGLEGTADMAHLARPLAEADSIAALHPLKSKVKARVVYVNKETKAVGLTLRSGSKTKKEKEKREETFWF
jgi:hypothetical protein